MLNLAVWFALPVLGLQGGPINGIALLILITAFVVLVRFKANVMLVIAGAAGTGLVETLLP